MNGINTALDEIPGSSVTGPLDGGHQSAVWRARFHNTDIALKVADPDVTNLAELRNRFEIVQQISTSTPEICHPIRLGTDAVTALVKDDRVLGYATASELAVGARPVPTERNEAVAIGCALARIHRESRRYVGPSLPGPSMYDVTAATRAPEASSLGVDRRIERLQMLTASAAPVLLHSDLGSHNVRLTAEGAGIVSASLLVVVFSQAA